MKKKKINFKLIALTSRVKGGISIIFKYIQINSFIQIIKRIAKNFKDDEIIILSINIICISLYFI